MSQINSVCVYCGSGPGNDPAFVASAKAMGHALAGAGIRLVYGGGSKGLMGAVADAVLADGGRVTGIIPQFLVDLERAHNGVEDIVITADMHERKWALFNQADAFVALPGGIGTLEELIEIMTWAQLGRHDKPIVIVDVNGFWSDLKSLLDHMNDRGFLHSTANLKPIFVDSAEAVLPAIMTN